MGRHWLQAIRFLLGNFVLVLLGVLILCGRTSRYSDSLVTDSSSPAQYSQTKNFADAIEILSSSAHGKKLIQQALKFWQLERAKDLLGVFHWSSYSKTDAVLTRHFNPDTGEEIREREVSIYLREAQSMDDLVIDMAHELVHATTRPSWDPYDPKLTPGLYIQTAIEGTGGEIEAIWLECQVGYELNVKKGISAERCKKYLLQNKSEALFSKEKIQKDFYRVGNWYRELNLTLGEEKKMFKDLSSDSPRLYSSTGHAPYPVALFKEYEEMTRTACVNSKKRLQTYQQRGLAQEGDSFHQQTLQFLDRRCK